MKGNPGPGEYDTIEVTPERINNKSNSTSTFGLSKKLNKVYDDIPGPGAYETKNLVGELPKFEQTIMVDKKKKKEFNNNWLDQRDWLNIFIINK